MIRSTTQDIYNRKHDDEESDSINDLPYCDASGNSQTDCKKQNVNKQDVNDDIHRDHEEQDVNDDIYTVYKEQDVTNIIHTDCKEHQPDR